MSTAHLVAPLPTGDVWDELAVGVLVCDGHGGVRAVTGHATRLLALDDRPVRWLLTDDRGCPLPDLPVLAAQVLHTDTAATVPIMVGGCRRLWLELYPVVSRGSRYALCVLRPVVTDALRDKGLLDPGTGLPSRVLLFDRLDQALRRARTRGTKATLVLAELPEPTEKALRDTATRLARGLGADHTVARYAGQVFAVVVDHPHGSGAPVAARVAELTPCPVRVGWVTSDGTHTVHDVVFRAESEVQA